jgi:hypothetical protein
MRIPGVTVDDVGIDANRVKINTAPDRTEDGVQIFWAIEDRRINAKTSDF